MQKWIRSIVMNRAKVWDYGICAAVMKGPWCKSGGVCCYGISRISTSTTSFLLNAREGDGGWRRSSQ